MTAPPGASAESGRWADLGTRLASGAALTAAAVAAIILGGAWLLGFVVVAVTLVVWELAIMAEARIPLLLAGLAGVALVCLALLPPGFGLPFAFLPVLAGIGNVQRARLPFAFFAAAIVLAGYGLIHLHADFGMQWMIWLVLVVAVTDIFGYFAGRVIGGPKFWPRVSPKKTWSGTVAGWLGAALIGGGFMLWGGAGSAVIGLSVALSMASQMGDIAESALKRRVGVKDSSHLLPGHGGFFDRFDGMLGASVMLLLVEQIVDFPPVGG